MILSARNKEMYMLDVAVDSTVLATDTWLSQVRHCITTTWVEQAFFSQEIARIA